jgi:NAD(P)H dehydrogenase (quinone)
MYAIMGITGRVGGLAAERLLDQGKQVRAILRNPEKAQKWRQRGAEVAIADYGDSKALAQAFSGAEGVFIMTPPNFAPAPGFVETHERMRVLKEALLSARPQKIVCLSSIGAEQTSGIGLIEHSHILEQSLGSLSIPAAFLRAGWFMDNCEWDVADAKKGKLVSYLQPLDHRIPMVATEDIGETVARVLTETWTGQRLIEIAGPGKTSPLDIARTFGAILNKKVEVEAVPREKWVGTFVAQGTPEDRTAPRVGMIDAFNTEWIHFGNPDTEKVVGKTELKAVLERLIQAEGVK